MTTLERKFIFANLQWKETIPTALYMFAIVPPPALSLKIHEQRISFSKKYGFKKALKPPVHITLFDPFTIQQADAARFEDHILSLKHWAQNQPSFKVELVNYSYFNNPGSPVIFIDVARNLHLKMLHASFVKQIKRHMVIKTSDKIYKPHVTIGYRDIDPGVFPGIKTHYSRQRFNASFKCDAIYLWKHDGHNWQIHEEFALDKKQEQLTLF